MTRRSRRLAVWGASVALACLVLVPRLVHAARPEGVPTKEGFEGITPETLRELYRMYSPPASLADVSDGRVAPDAIPDVFGHGSVLTVGKVIGKITNFGFNGNPFTNVSSDPGGQWPGQSGVEYLFAVAIACGGVNPGVSPGDPTSRRRVSSGTEWRPPTLQPEDRIYPSYDGAVNGVRFSNDDGDKFFDQDGVTRDLIDEDFLDGRDNDGDSRVDEDFGALGQQMFSLVMRDDTPESIAFTQAEPHVPVGLECRERAWAYSIARLENFNVFEFQFINRSGHEIDSLVVAFPTDMDCGPVEKSNYFTDDLDAPQYPSGSFTFVLPDDDKRRQTNHDSALDPPGTPPGSVISLCDHLNIRVNGFSIADDDGDEGKTPGVPALLLINHTIDPTGVNGPWRVGWRAFRSYTGGTPYTQGGPPRIDQQRFEFMTGFDNIDNDPGSDRYGFINAEPGDQKGDYAAWASVGPWFHVAPNASVTVTVAFAVQRGTFPASATFPTKYAAFRRDSLASPGGHLSAQAGLFADFPALKNAYDAQVAYEGIWEIRAAFPTADCHGCETSVRLPRGSLPDPIGKTDCRNENPKPLSPDFFTWFDFDCDYCTGVYQASPPQGFFHKVWNASAPPPSPVLNASVSYNYTDNPNRLIAPAGDNSITLAWNNLSETSPDPSDKKEFDFRGYKIWKVANWTRPVGSPGPAEEEWSLIAEFKLFEYNDGSNNPIPNNAIRKKAAPPGGDPGDTLVFPKVWIPQRRDSLVIRLNRGDLWDVQSGIIMRPDTSIKCVKDELGRCIADTGCVMSIEPCRKVGKIRYPVGRYHYVDNEVKNGFLYFYSVTAFDSTRDGMTEGRRSAVEAEGVTPQIATREGRKVWVVPNPYKGYSAIVRRPSSWDLTPNATDPTGTHVDFMGLPRGGWTIRIYTVSGDLVQEIHSTDAVNESVRSTIVTPNGTLPGYNRQQDTPNDGQARWNLISRNGQDIVSGIYLFTVDSSQGTQRGRFVVVR